MRIVDERKAVTLGCEQNGVLFPSCRYSPLYRYTNHQHFLLYERVVAVVIQKHGKLSIIFLSYIMIKYFQLYDKLNGHRSSGTYIIQTD